MKIVLALIVGLWATAAAPAKKTKRASAAKSKASAAAKAKAEASPAAPRPTISGEIALTDIIGRKMKVRLGGGANIDFVIGEGTKVTRAVEDKPDAAIAFETLKIGERVEIRTLDWKTADEIRVGPAR